jgi:hypothetical protein
MRERRACEQAQGAGAFPRWYAEGEIPPNSVLSLPLCFRLSAIGKRSEANSLIYMVGATGIEPVTPTMSTWCSPAELRARTSGRSGGARCSEIAGDRQALALVDTQPVRADSARAVP